MMKRINNKMPGFVKGFTLMELLIVMTLLALIAAIAVPVVSNSVNRAKEATLKEDLQVMRKIIDDYYADVGSYPESLKVLVEKKYLRKIPVDPFTERDDTWVEVYAENQNGIIDIKSGAEGSNSDGSAYRDW